MKKMEFLEKIARKLLFPIFLHWYLFEEPKKIIKIWTNFLRFGMEFFSIPLLLKTLFSYWRGYQWKYTGRGLDIPKMLEIKFSNFISRILGAIIRLVIILFGFFFEGLVFILGPIILTFWFAFPIISLIILIYAFKFII